MTRKRSHFLIVVLPVFITATVMFADEPKNNTVGLLPDEQLAIGSILEGIDEISLVSANGNRVRLTQRPGYDGFPCWSPDGRRIAFISRPLPDADIDLFVMDADGSNIRQLTTIGGFEGPPSWSPDGKTIAFASGHNLDGTERTGQNRGRERICLINSDGSDLRLLSEETASQPAWSPVVKRLRLPDDNG